MRFRVMQIIDNFKSRINDSSVFYTLGLFLPLSLIIYRTYSILQNKVYTFHINFSFFESWNVWGVAVFCYIPALLFFFFLLFFENFNIFVTKLFLKCNILFLIYCKISKIELYFYHHKKNGTMLYVLYMIFYLYSLYMGSVLELLFVISRLFIGSYFSFRLFFYMERRKENSFFMEKFNFLSFFHIFSKYDFLLDENKKSEEKKGKDQFFEDNNIIAGKGWFSGINSLVFICLYKKNCTVKNDIKTLDKKCEDILCSLDRSEIVQYLRIDKNMIFPLNERKPFFFYVSQELYGGITKKCNNFFERLNNL